MPRAGIVPFVTSFAFACALAVAPPAFAHATLLRSSPPDGAILAASPAQVLLTFDDTVRPAGARAIRNTNGSSVLGGEAHNPRGRPREVIVPLRASAGKGDYTVRWQVLSDDGHLITGVLVFAVGRGSSPPVAALSAGGGPSAWDVLKRFLVFAGIALAIGGSGARALFPAGARAERLAPAAVVAGFAVAFVGLVPVLWAGDAESETRFGRVSLAGVGVALAGAAIALAALQRRRLWPLAAIAALALAAVPPVRGHPLDPGQPRWLNLVLDLAHELTVAFWLGGAALVLLLRDRTTARGFLVPAVALLPVVAGTGIARGFFELSAPDQLWTSGYGRALLVKTGLALLALPLLWRTLSVFSGGGRLATPLAGQVALLTGALVAVSVMTDLRPGRAPVSSQPRSPVPVHSAPPPKPPLDVLSLGAEADDLAVGLSIRRQGRRLGLEADVIDGEGHGLAGLDVDFRAGARSTAAAPCTPGCYRAGVPFASRIVVSLAGPKRRRAQVAFELPAHWPARPGARVIERASRVFRTSRRSTSARGSPRTSRRSSDRAGVWKRRTASRTPSGAEPRRW